MLQQDWVATLFDKELSRFISKSSFLIPDHIVASGWLEHAAFAFWLIESLAPTTYVELGTHQGYSYFSVCQIVSELNLGTACYAVDTWQGDEHAGFYDETVYENIVNLNRKYNSFSTLVRATFESALKYFPDASIDLLHIDGRHFYDDVKADYETWLPKLTPNAIVLFHDTNVRERDFGVWRLFCELKNTYPTFEFLHGNGLGLLAVGEIPSALRDLFSATSDETNNIRSIYSYLGANLTARWLAKDHTRLTNDNGLLRQELATTTAAINALQVAAEHQRQEIQIHLMRNEDLSRRNEYLSRRLKTAETTINTIATSEALRVACALRKIPFARQLAALIERVGAIGSPKDQSLEDTVAKVKKTGLFEHNYYLANNPHVALSGTDPALHFVVEGWKVGCRPTPLFDPLFYQKHNAEVLKTGVNPLLHFAEEGWKEGRQPSADFDLVSYLDRNPDVADAGINPLLHYLTCGQSEGR